jgi:AcrR family transcriptional regulator
VVLQVTGPPAPETLGQAQLARRERIVRTALHALANSDYEQLRISQIARDSGSSLGTVYRYFSSKEHLFAAVFVEWQGALKKKLQTSHPEGSTEAARVRDVFHRTIRAFQLQPQFFRVTMILQATTDTYAAELYHSVSSQFRDTVQTAFEGPFDHDREEIYRIMNLVLDGSLRGWVLNGLTIDDVYKNIDDAIRLIYEHCSE